MQVRRPDGPRGRRPPGPRQRPCPPRPLSVLSPGWGSIPRPRGRPRSGARSPAPLPLPPLPPAPPPPSDLASQSFAARRPFPVQRSRNQVSGKVQDECHGEVPARPHAGSLRICPPSSPPAGSLRVPPPPAAGGRAASALRRAVCCPRFVKPAVRGPSPFSWSRSSAAPLARFEAGFHPQRPPSVYSRRISSLSGFSSSCPLLFLMKMKRSFLWLRPPPPHDRPEMSNPSSLKEIKAALQGPRPGLVAVRPICMLPRFTVLHCVFLSVYANIFLFKSAEGNGRVYLKSILPSRPSERF